MVNTTCNNYVVSLYLITPNAPIIVELNELILGSKGSRAKRETTTCRLRKEKKRKKEIKQTKRHRVDYQRLMNYNEITTLLCFKSTKKPSPLMTSCRHFTPPPTYGRGFCIK